MGKQQIDIFNIDIYRQIINLFNSYLNKLKKYLSIDVHMLGYYTNEEMYYIISVYCDMIEDLTKSRAFIMFMPKNAIEEINKTFLIINNLKKQRMHERILEKLAEIKKIITIDI